MRKILTALLILTVIFSISDANITAKAATNTSNQTDITLLENGDYLETTISDSTTFLPKISLLSTNKSITKTKTVKYKNKNGTLLWYVAIKATFTYNGTTSKCTSRTPSAAAPASTWSIKSLSSSKSGNSATATAVATQTGIISQDYTKSVTISCNKNGVVS